MALILGVDRFMSECRALTNIIGNAVATIVVAKWEGALDEGDAGSGFRWSEGGSGGPTFPIRKPFVLSLSKGVLFFLKKKGTDFDKLSPNGVCWRGRR